MMANSKVGFGARNILFLQEFLRNRGVSVSNQRKQELIQLCEAADKLQIELDPDGLLEDRSDSVRSKLRTWQNKELTLPSLMATTADLSQVPVVTVFDLLQYLSKGHNYSSLRNHRQLEGYTMCKDGFVLDLQGCRYKSEEEGPYAALLGKVKPRTNPKDPTTGLPYYLCWIILTTVDEEERIISAYCSCRGGIDGFCRHVTAVLFEFIEFMEDGNKKTCTSQPCMWNSRRTWKEKQPDPVEIAQLETSVTCDKRSQPREDVPSGSSAMTVPSPDKFFRGLPMVAPQACILAAVHIQDYKNSLPALTTKTPVEKLKAFQEDHVCAENCICSKEFSTHLQYSHDDIEHIKLATHGQADNENWHAMRKHILTASTFKTICHSLNLRNTAIQLCKENPLQENFLPAPVSYGRRNESKARSLFLRCHRLLHKKCSVKETGLFFSHDYPFIACSPDGIVTCTCGTFLIEIKCLWKFRKFHPKTAGKMSGLVTEETDGTIVIAEKHAYNYQIQGQMGVTNIRRAVLVIFTDKGICPVNVPFNQDMWGGMLQKLQTFYYDFYFSVICSQC